MRLTQHNSRRTNTCASARFNRHVVVGMTMAIVALVLVARVSAQAAPFGPPHQLGFRSEQQCAISSVDPRLSVPVDLIESASIDAGWSKAFVAVLLPIGPILYATFLLATALKKERQRRTIVTPPSGYVLANGRIRAGRSKKQAAIRVDFELERTKTKKGHVLYRERTHEIYVRPFTLETSEGECLDIQPHHDTTTLHAPVEGEHCTRWTQVAAGDHVWVYGRLSTRPSSTDAARDGAQRSGACLDGRGARLLVSTEPMGSLFRRDRNRRLGLAAALIAWLGLLEFGAFGSYWAVLQAGRPVVGHVVTKSEWSRTSRERFGRSNSSWIHAVTVEAEGHRKRFEIGASSWNAVCEQTPASVLLAPNAMTLGTQPRVTIGRCLITGLLMLCGLTAVVLLGRVETPWYSSTRGWRGTDRPPRADQKNAT
ncbi:MAG: hypothetical protein ACM3ZE_14265 [Myxococcales bacterium]